MTAPVPAKPEDPIAAIVKAFAIHPLVALGDNHGNVQLHEFRLALIRDARLAGVVNDIVVEFGTAAHQDVIDRFVAGEDVPDAVLQRVWQDTTQVEETWDLPIYEAFLRAVREVNTSRPRQHQLRVLLGDPPVDWTAVRSGDDVRAFPDRDRHAADVIRREVLAKQRRALVIYGDQHLVRRTSVIDAPDPWARGVVALLEKDRHATLFTIHSETRADLAAAQADVATWPRPSLARLAGTTLGAHVDDAAPGRRRVAQQDQFDAVLYLGPPATMTRATLSAARCRDEAYLRMRVARLALLPAPGNAPSDPADRVIVGCAFRTPGPATSDAEPAFTALVRDTVADAVSGRIEPARFAPERRDRLVRFFETYGKRLFPPLGVVQSIALVDEATVIGRRFRRYRVTHEKAAVTWIVGMADDRTIASMEPRRD